MTTEQTARAGWREAVWGDLATLEYGKSLRNYRSSDGPYRVYGTNGPIGWHSEPLFHDASVIIGRKGAYRGVHYSPAPFFVIDTAFYLQPKVELDMRWAYYQLMTVDINGMDSGSAIPSTSRTDFYGVPVKVPPLTEQRSIAHILGTLDDKIELNRRMNQTLEEMTRAIFKDWFIDFGPTRAKMEGREPYLSEEVWNLFPKVLSGDAMARLPQGWRRFMLDELANLHRESLSPSKEPDKVFEHYSIPSFDSGQFPSYETGENIRSNKVIVRAGTVLLSKLNPQVSRVWIPNPLTRHTQVASTEFLQFGPKAGFGQGLLCCLLKSDNFRLLLEGMVTGTSKSHQRVHPKALLNHEVIAGDSATFDGFESLLSPILTRITSNKIEAQSLAGLRDALLPRLVSGSLRVGSCDTEFSDLADL